MVVLGSVGGVTGSPTDGSARGGTDGRVARGPEAAIAVLSGASLAFILAMFSLGLARETLHFNCSWGIGGEWGVDGTWVCADGIGYLFVAVILGGMSALLCLAGLLTAVTPPSRGRSIVFVSLAAVSLVWVGWWTYYAATAYTGPRPEGETGLGVWAVAVLPALALAVLGLLSAAVGALTRHRWSLWVLWGGIALIVAGTVVQPGIGIASMVSAGLLAAAAADRPGLR